MDQGALEVWAHDQRALARALGLSIEEWIGQLEAAAERKTGLYAAAIGAATVSGLGLAVLDRLDGAKLAQTARALIDPKPPEVRDPVLAEAIRRADEVDAAAGRGAARLKRSKVDRDAQSFPSAQEKTADAPGEEEEE